jgi:hypothetical protein
MGQKMVRFAELCGTRSCQAGASIEVHEAGRIRPFSGGNGGHVLSLYPLIWRSLLPCTISAPSKPCKQQSFSREVHVAMAAAPSLGSW